MSPERPASSMAEPPLVPGAERFGPRRGHGRGGLQVAVEQRAAGWRRRSGPSRQSLRASATVPPAPASSRRRVCRGLRPEGGAEALVGPLVPVDRVPDLAVARIGRPPHDPAVVGQAGVERAGQAAPQRDQPLEPGGRDEVEQRGGGEEVGRLVAEGLEVGPQVERGGSARPAPASAASPAAISAGSISTRVHRCPAGSSGARRRRVEPVPAPRSIDVRPAPRRGPGGEPVQRGGVGGAGVVGLAQREPGGGEAPAHRAASPPSAASAPSIAAAVSSQRGRRSRAASGAGPEAGAQAGVRQDAAQRLAERGRVAGRDEEPGVGRDGVGDGTSRGGDDRQAAGQALGQRHAVALVERGGDQQVGGGVGGVEAGGVELAGERDAVGEAEVADRRADGRGGGRVAVGAPGEDEPPPQATQARERLEQEPVALARGQRADAEEPRRVAGRGRERGRVGARHRDGEPLPRHAEVRRERARGGRARGDHAAAGGQGPTLARRAAGRHRAGSRPVSRHKGWWTRATRREAVPVARGDRRHGAQRQAVDDRGRPVGKPGQGPVGGGQGGLVREREPVGQAHEAHPPAPPGERGEGPAVVDVAAGAGREVAGMDEGDRPAPQTASSNEAQATWLSRSVTLRPVTFSPPGPRRPALMASRTRPKTCRARNSVVVLRPGEGRQLVEVAVVQLGRAPPSDARARGRCRRRCRSRRCRRSGTRRRRRRWRRAAAGRGRRPRPGSCARS